MMTPVTLIIDRKFPGLGRLKKATGTTIPAVKRKMSRMLTDLYEQGRIDLLRAIRDGQLTLMQVWDAYQRRALSDLPVGITAKPLVDAMQGWVDGLLPGVDYSEKHIESIGTSIDYFKRERNDALVADLPALLEALRLSLGREHPRSFNLCRAHASAFVRATLKKSHPLWLAINAVEPRAVPKRDPRPDLTPEWMRNVFPSPETDRVDAIAWGMVLTGMGPKEYWGSWGYSDDRIIIHGTKRAARRREVPLIVLPQMEPMMSRDNFRKAVHKRTDGKVSPYDFRRAYARWLERAGVMRSRRRHYMGHAAGDVTGLYEQHEITAYLISDAQLMRQWLGIEPKAPAIKLEKAQ